jgi:hypothetical protein
VSTGKLAPVDVSSFETKQRPVTSRKSPANTGENGVGGQACEYDGSGALRQDVSSSETV